MKGAFNPLQAKGILKVNIETTIGINFYLRIFFKNAFKSVFNLMVFSKAFQSPELRAHALKTEGAELYNAGGAYNPVITFPSGRALSLCDGVSVLRCLFATECGVVLKTGMCSEERSQT